MFVVPGMYTFPPQGGVLISLVLRLCALYTAICSYDMRMLETSILQAPFHVGASEYPPTLHNKLEGEENRSCHTHTHTLHRSAGAPPVCYCSCVPKSPSTATKFFRVPRPSMDTSTTSPALRNRGGSRLYLAQSTQGTGLPRCWQHASRLDAHYPRPNAGPPRSTQGGARACLRACTT